jgi:hypothetical protein
MTFGTQIVGLLLFKSIQISDWSQRSPPSFQLALEMLLPTKAESHLLVASKG